MTGKGRVVAKADPVSVDLLPVCKSPGCGVVGRAGEVMCDGHAAQQRVLAAQRKLAEATPMMADQLINIALNGQTEEVRRRASEAVLDRAGIRPGVEITLATSSADGPSAGDLLRERLALLRSRTLDGTAWRDPLGLVAGTDPPDGGLEEPDDDSDQHHDE